MVELVTIKKEVLKNGKILHYSNLKNSHISGICGGFGGKYFGVELYWYKSNERFYALNKTAQNMFKQKTGKKLRLVKKTLSAYDRVFFINQIVGLKPTNCIH